MPETTDRALTERENDIRELNEQIRQYRASEAVKREAADAFAEQCKASGLDPIKGLRDEDKEAFHRIDKAYKEADEQAEIATELEHRLQSLVRTTGHEAAAKAKGDIEHPAVRATLNMADAFMASEEYRQLKRSGRLESFNARIETNPVQVASREKFISTLFGDTSLAATLNPRALIPVDDRIFPVQMIPQRALRVRDLVNVTTTDTDTIEYVVEVTHTDAAAETSYGALAPESNYEYEARQVFVRRIPHYVKATKGNLRDQGQLRGLLDSNLIYGVGKHIDNQMVNGTGAATSGGETLQGILETVGLPDVDGTFGAEGAENVPDAFHLGMTAVRLSLEDEPTAFLVHPEIYEQFVLAKGEDGHYLNLQGPQSNTPANFWGLPVVTSSVMPNDSALVGNFNVGATLWVRSGVEVAVTDSDSDDFRRGIITILAEARVGFAVTQPLAFCEVTNIGATA